MALPKNWFALEDAELEIPEVTISPMPLDVAEMQEGHDDLEILDKDAAQLEGDIDVATELYNVAVEALATGGLSVYAGKMANQQMADLRKRWGWGFKAVATEDFLDDPKVATEGLMADAIDFIKKGLKALGEWCGEIGKKMKQWILDKRNIGKRMKKDIKALRPSVEGMRDDRGMAVSVTHQLGFLHCGEGMDVEACAALGDKAMEVDDVSRQFRAIIGGAEGSGIDFGGLLSAAVGIIGEVAANGQKADPTVIAGRIQEGMAKTIDNTGDRQNKAKSKMFEVDMQEESINFLKSLSKSSHKAIEDTFPEKMRGLNAMMGFAMPGGVVLGTVKHESGYVETRMGVHPFVGKAEPLPGLERDEALKYLDSAWRIADILDLRMNDWEACADRVVKAKGELKRVTEDRVTDPSVLQQARLNISAAFAIERALTTSLVNSGQGLLDYISQSVIYATAGRAR